MERNNIKYYRPSLFRILTNYTLNVVLILILILTIPIYFQGNLDKFLVPNIALEVGLVSGIIIDCILGFNTTILSISNKSLTYQSALIKQKIINIELKDIDHINESGYDLIIYKLDNTKVKIELIKDVKTIRRDLNKILKKRTLMSTQHMNDFTKNYLD